MNEDDQNLQPWIEPELEARVVAWVLGEASAFEVAELEREIEEKPELMLFKRRIDAVHGLAGVAVRPQRPELRLAPERRRKLLQTLGGAAPVTKMKVSAFRRSRPAWLTGGLLARVAACLIFLMTLAILVRPSMQSSLLVSDARRSSGASSSIGDPAGSVAQKKTTQLAQSHMKLAEPQDEWKVARESLARLGTENDLNARAGGAPGGVTLNGTGTITANGGTLTLGNSAASINKTGAGTLILSGNNTYSGATVVNEGTLATRYDKVPVLGDVPAVGELYREKQQDGTRAMDANGLDAVFIANGSSNLTLATRTETSHGIVAYDEAARMPADASGDSKFADAPAAAKNREMTVVAGAGATIIAGTITVEDAKGYGYGNGGGGGGGGGGSAGGGILKLVESQKAERADLLAEEGGERLAEMKAPASSAAPSYYDNFGAAGAPASSPASPAEDADYAMAAAGSAAPAKPQEVSPSTPSAFETRNADALKMIVRENAPVQRVLTNAEQFSQAAAEPMAPGAPRPLATTGATAGDGLVQQAQAMAAQEAMEPGAAMDADDYEIQFEGAPTTPAAAAPSNSARGVDLMSAPTVTAKSGTKAVTTVTADTSYTRRLALPVAKSDSSAISGGNRSTAISANTVDALEFADTAQKQQLATLSYNGGVGLDMAEKDRDEKPAAPTGTAITGIRAGDGKVLNSELEEVRSEAGKSSGEVAQNGKSELEKLEAPRAKWIGKDAAPAAAQLPALRPSPPRHESELAAADQPFSTFSLHVADVSFQLAKDALARGEMPNPEQIRPEEFYNAFDYGDPAPSVGEQVACRVEQSAHPLLQQRNLVRIAMKVAAAGRNASQPLRLTILLDTSGSMEREDRADSVRRALASLASLLGPDDRVTLVGFARQPHLLAESVPGDQAAKLVEIAARTPSEGGTNLEQALNLATELADSQYVATAQNRVVLLTDGAANLGNADPAQLAKGVDKMRQHGIAFDACGVGADGLNDAILEALTRKGDGRYYFLNKPADADAGFAKQLAGAFHPAAENVKVQVRFNPRRVGKYKLLGFEQHRLNKQDFRNDKVDAAELSAEEAAVALYQVEPLPDGEGDLGEVFIRFRDPASGRMVERSWTMRYDAQAPAFDKASPSMQLAGMADVIAERLRGDISQEDLRSLAPIVNSLRGAYPQQARVQELADMFGQLVR